MTFWVFFSKVIEDFEHRILDFIGYVVLEGDEQVVVGVEPLDRLLWLLLLSDLLADVKASEGLDYIQHEKGHSKLELDIDHKLVHLQLLGILLPFVVVGLENVVPYATPPSLSARKRSEIGNVVACLEFFDLRVDGGRGHLMKLGLAVG